MVTEAQNVVIHVVLMAVNRHLLLGLQNVESKSLGWILHNFRFLPTFSFLISQNML